MRRSHRRLLLAVAGCATLLCAPMAAPRAQVATLTGASEAHVPDGLHGDLAPMQAVLDYLHDNRIGIVFHRAEKSPRTGFGLEFASTDLYREHAEVYYPEGSEAHQIYHELLHIKRNYALGVQALVACPGADDDTRRNLAELNNNLDHAFVVPEEVAAYPGAAPYWERDFDRMLKEVSWSPTVDMGIANAQRAVLLEGWLILPHIPSLAAVVDAYRGRLEERGWLDAANAMTEAVQAAGPNKKAAVAALRQALGYPSPALCCYETLGHVH